MALNPGELNELIELNKKIKAGFTSTQNTRRRVELRSKATTDQLMQAARTPAKEKAQAVIKGGPKKPVTQQVQTEAPKPQKPAAPPKAAKPPRTMAPAGTVVQRRTPSSTARPAAGGAMARGARPGSTGTLKPKAVKAKPQAATPKGVDVDKAIDKTLVPWSQRKDVPWGGGPNSVNRFRTEIQRLHDEIKGDLDTSIAQQEAKIRRFSGLRGENLERFVKDARKGVPENRVDRMDLISTRGREGVWNGMLDASGNPVVGDNLGDVTGTDIFARVQGDVKGIDVHDTFTDNRQSVRLGLKKGIYRGGRNAMSTASGSDRIIDIFNASDGLEDKLTQARPGVIRGVKTEPQYVKDFLVGGTYDRVKRGGVEVPGNPRMFHKGYAVDLDVLRNNLMGATVEQIEKIPGARIINRGNSFGIELPHKELVAFGDGQSTRNLLLSSEVQEAVKDRGGKLYGGIPEPWVKGLKTNWRGGVGATLLNGASREAGVKLGKGDYTGAATEFGTTYALGAGFEHGLKGITKALSKRAPGIVTRFAGGTSGSGGLLGPVLAVTAGVEVADGIVEGVTGKDTISHINDGMVKPYYQRTTGDTRSDEQIQSNLTGPKRVYGSDKPKPTKPQMSKKAVAAASAHLSKMVPEVSPEPPTPTVTATVKPKATPVKARRIAGAWAKRRRKK